MPSSNCLSQKTQNVNLSKNVGQIKFIKQVKHIKFRSRLAQSAFEAAMITTVMLLLFGIFFVVLSNRSYSMKKAQDEQLMQDYARVISGELRLAWQSENGYRRDFELKDNLADIAINVTLLTDPNYINHSEIIITSVNYSYSIEIIEAVGGVFNGSFTTGTNTVRKNNDRVCLNLIKC